jgi:hypothetical protein
MTQLDPNYDLVRSPKVPLTPQQLEDLRPKPAAPAPKIDEAKALAYKTGIKDLEPLVRRIIFLEMHSAAQAERIERLESKKR